MKSFLMSFLGSLAALWVSLTLVVVLGMFFVAIAVVGSSQQGGVTVKPHSILRLDLSGQIADRPSPRDIIGEITGQAGEKVLPLDRMVAAIDGAADDDNIDAIYIECNGAQAGLAQTQAIVDALARFRDSGKPVYAYADQMTQGNYVIAAAGADSVFVNPIAMLDIHGLSATTLYYKELMDKIGVEAQIVKVGTYKSAVEPFMLNEMSAANREQQAAYLGSIWHTLAEQIAQGRGVTVDTVNVWADSYSYTKSSEWLMANGLVDATAYRHEMMERLGALTESKKPREPHMVDFTDYYDVAVKAGHGKTQIAVLYALGDITEDGSSGIASSRLVPQILDLADDEKVDALILRVNSGGGSAYASEQIWEALEQYKKISGKPFYVSMGDVAASGGYYISCGADRIYADKVTLTGSIGIFGIIPSAHKLMADKLGIHSATVATNTTEQLTFLKPMGERQRAAMQGYVDAGYELFTRRVAEGRSMSQDSVKAIAEGRVWDGLTASRIGLVDKLGGLDMAIADMAEELGVESGDFYVKSYPAVKFKWWEELVEQTGQLQQSRIEQFAGPLAPLYRAVRSVETMDNPVQCRMQPVVID